MLPARTSIWPHDPNLNASRKPGTLQASVFADLIQRLKSRARRRAPPSTALPIGRESRRIGGGPKPWSDIFERLLDGRIRFWLDGEPDADHLLVGRGSLDAFIGRRSSIDPAEGRPRTSTMSTGDAAELLNVKPGHVVRLASAGVLTRSAGLRAMTVPRIDVEQLARGHVSPAELARRARTSAETVNTRLRAAGFVHFHGLWERSAALEALPLT